jgi:hypothetical protein
LPRERQVEERVRPLRIERRPSVEYVALGRIDAAGLGREIPQSSRRVQRQVLLAAAHESSVLGVRVRAVVDPPGSLQSLPIDARRSIVLVSVAALEQAAGERIERRRQRCSGRGRNNQETAREHVRERHECHPGGTPQEWRQPRE